MIRPKLTGSIDARVPLAPPPETQSPHERRSPTFITHFDGAAPGGYLVQTFAR